MKILAVGAHPDDIEISCAGTLLKYVKRGDTVFACHLSDGDMGHVEIMPEELGAIRRKEAQSAGELGGYNVIWGGFHDLDIFADNRAARDRLVEIIRDTAPDLIITHNPDDYMPDHTATSKLVFDASFAASIPHYPCKNPTVVPVTPIYYMESMSGMDFTPTEYVDISEVEEEKESLLACHKSQIEWLLYHDGQDELKKIRSTAEYRGFQCGEKYAEGFRCCFAAGRMSAKRLLP